MHRLSFANMIRARVRDYSDQNQGSAPFCFFEDKTVTFAGMAATINQTAHALAHGGVARGDRVALMLPNSVEHMAIFFALCALGAVVVPVSVHLRQSGLQLQLDSAMPHIVIADPSYHDMAQALPAAASVRCVIWCAVALPGEFDAKPQVLLGDLLGDLLVDAGEPRAVNAAAAVNSVDGNSKASANHNDGLDSLDLDSVCAICYTSGTTGAPKGVMLTQRWFQIGAKNAALLADARASDVLFLWEPFYHVAGWITVLIAWQRGIPVVLVEKFSASQCWQQICQHGATLFHYLGGALNLLLKQQPSASDSSNPVRVAWGAAAPVQSWRAFEARFGLRIREGYGISEAGNFTLLNLDGPVGSIGKPAEEFDAWIETAQGLRAGPKEVGEIVLRPRYPGLVMAGYFNDPVRSAEVLRSGCVHTGDLGWQDADGWFYFSGRKKDALRRRGENVSAWEVERVINAHEAVEESAVVGVASSMGEDDIFAFVKPASGKAIDALALVRWCEQHLAYYQIPRYVHIVADFPRGPTQRIRKTELLADTSLAWDFEQSGERFRAHRAQSHNVQP